MSLFSGARSRIGFTNFHDEGLYRGNLTNRPVRYNAHVHIAVNFISLVNKALGRFETPYSFTPVSPDEWVLAKASVSSETVETVKSKISNLYPAWKDQKLLLFNVNASDMLPQRRWPPENFVTVAKKILARFRDVLIICTGAPDERDYVDKVVKAIDHDRCVNSSGVFSFDELVPLYSISEFMLTNDSGPAHFASVTSLKVFVLFGPETPNLYLPLGGNAESIYLGLPCSPCVSAANHRKTSCIPRPCITGIPTSMVFDRLNDFLNEKQVH